MNSRKLRGFTLIELMVVIVVLIILAGIVIVSYRTWRAQTAETAVESDLNSLVSAMENSRNWGEGYPVFSPNAKFAESNSATNGVFVQSGHTEITYRSGNSKGYCADAKSTDVTSIKYFVNTNSGDKKAKPGTCS